MNTRKHIITCYHHSFAGGSKNASRFFHRLAEDGFSVDGYFYEVPQYFSYTETKVRVHSFDADIIRSEVIDSGVTKNYSIVSGVIENLMTDGDAVLMGVNLFPYCDILHDVKNQIRWRSNREPKLILHPVGSDIWQIGPKIKSRVKWLLDSPLVNHVVTYSQSFSDEIKEFYGVDREISVLPPVLEKDKFFPLGQEEIAKRRAALNLRDDDFVIHVHNSMRKVKCPEIIIEIAKLVSTKLTQRTILIMVGPVPVDLVRSVGINLTEIGKNGSSFKYFSQIDRLTVYWTGVSNQVEYLLQLSDVELNASLHDSFNIALMEAMACAVPVVTSNLVGIMNDIKSCDGGYGFPTKKLSFDSLNALFLSNKPTRDYFDVAYAVDSLVDIGKNKDIAKKMGLSASSYVAERFDFSRASEKLRRMLN